MKVLLIEDAIVQARDIVRVLHGMGHEVVWLNGVTAIDADGTIHPAVCGMAFSLAPDCHTSGVLHCSDFQMALLDGTSDGALYGWDLAVQLPMPCIGISNSADHNKRIAGVTNTFTTCLKPDVCSALLSGQLDLEAALSV
jgi:hypothetical protein